MSENRAVGMESTERYPGDPEDLQRLHLTCTRERHNLHP